MNDDRDAAAVSRVLSGDVNAFEGIVRRWQGPLVTLAYRFCRDRNRAEEMAQAAFLRAYQKLAKWSGEGHFRSWLFALATNVYRSEVRRDRRFALPLDDARDVILSCTDSEAEDQDRKRRVRLEISRLPARYRDTITLFYFHGMDVQETANSLNVAPGTVKARLHRGRELLKKKLEHIIKEDDSGKNHE